MKIELLDVVALTGNLPEYNLRRGQVGTVVEILADGKAFEVEFSARDGRTYEIVFGQVSSEAKRCPHCDQSDPVTPWWYYLIGGFILLAILRSCMGG